MPRQFDVPPDSRARMRMLKDQQASPEKQKSEPRAEDASGQDSRDQEGLDREV